MKIDVEDMVRAATHHDQVLYEGMNEDLRSETEAFLREHTLDALDELLDLPVTLENVLRARIAICTRAIEQGDIDLEWFGGSRSDMDLAQPLQRQRMTEVLRKMDEASPLLQIVHARAGEKLDEYYHSLSDLPAMLEHLCHDEAEELNDMGVLPHREDGTTRTIGELLLVQPTKILESIVDFEGQSQERQRRFDALSPKEQEAEWTRLVKLLDKIEP